MLAFDLDYVRRWNLIWIMLVFDLDYVLLELSLDYMIFELHFGLCVIGVQTNLNTKQNIFLKTLLTYELFIYGFTYRFIYILFTQIYKILFN